MDFIDEIKNLSDRIAKQKDVIQTEEATKIAFVMPFIKILGYDVYNPTEVVPEFTADTGIKQGEKVDYAIFKDDQAIILIECKKYGEDLSDAHTSQLFRYFSVVHARFGVLTDGVLYRFYTDLEESNIMDSKPFLELNMLDVQPASVNELKCFTKSAFDLDETLTAATDMKYTKEIKEIMTEQLEAPHEDFVRFFLSSVYNGVRTQPVIEQFTDIVKRALNRFVNEQINQRLQFAITTEESTEQPPETEINDAPADEEETEPRIVTTEEELEGYYIVKSIVREVVSADRIYHRDTVEYISILLDDSIRKLICRLHFNTSQKRITLFKYHDGKREDVALKIDNIDDIYNHAEALKEVVQYYDAPTQQTEQQTKSDDNL